MLGSQAAFRRFNLAHQALSFSMPSLQSPNNDAPGDFRKSDADDSTLTSDILI
jgi:hypothetical protein